MPRAKGIQIYLKPGIEEDDILLNLWEICKTKSRPQEMFRRLLQKGLLQMISQNDISESILEEIGYRRTEEDSEIQIVEKIVPEKALQASRGNEKRIEKQVEKNTYNKAQIIDEPSSSIERQPVSSVNSTIRHDRESIYNNRTETEENSGNIERKPGSSTKPTIGKDLM